MTTEANGILNTENTIDITKFVGTDALWEGWRVKFEAFADLAWLIAQLDIAAEQTALIANEGLLAHHKV